jgi:hypothetical protein
VNLTLWREAHRGELDKLVWMLRMNGDGPCDSGSRKANGGTGGDYRMVLERELALDGCVFYQGIFCDFL